MQNAPRKPIDPEAHGVIDYAFALFLFVVPNLLGLNWIARMLSYGFGAAIGGVNAFSAPKGVRPLLSFREHGKMDEPMIPAMMLLPWLTGQLGRRGPRAYFALVFGMAAANFFLTDYNHDGRSVPARLRPRRSAKVMVGSGI